MPVYVAPGAADVDAPPMHITAGVQSCTPTAACGGDDAVRAAWEAYVASIRGRVAHEEAARALVAALGAQKHSDRATTFIATYVKPLLRAVHAAIEKRQPAQMEAARRASRTYASEDAYVLVRPLPRASHAGAARALTRRAV